MTTQAKKCGPTDSQDEQFADHLNDVDPTPVCLLPKIPNSIRRSPFEQRRLDLQTCTISKLMLTKVLGRPVSVSTGALCRVCKAARFHALDVPDSSTTTAEAHPELPWCSGILCQTCAKISRLLRTLSMSFIGPLPLQPMRYLIRLAVRADRALNSIFE
jgi:hypothetical protein